jgi:hypothetical protein
MGVPASRMRTRLFSWCPASFAASLSLPYLFLSSILNLNRMPGTTYCRHARGERATAVKNAQQQANQTVLANDGCGRHHGPFRRQRPLPHHAA